MAAIATGRSKASRPLFGTGKDFNSGAKTNSSDARTTSDATTETPLAGYGTGPGWTTRGDTLNAMATNSTGSTSI